MSDYINKDAFVKDITERYCSGCNDHFGVKCKACWVDDMLGEIDDAKVADAVELKTGHWEIAIGYDIRRCCQCSECRKMAFEPSDFCPACGAKMDEVRE